MSRPHWLYCDLDYMCVCEKVFVHFNFSVDNYFIHLSILLLFLLIIWDSVTLVNDTFLLYESEWSWQWPT